MLLSKFFGKPTIVVICGGVAVIVGILTLLLWLLMLGKLHDFLVYSCNIIKTNVLLLNLLYAILLLGKTVLFYLLLSLRQLFHSCCL